MLKIHQLFLRTYITIFAAILITLTLVTYFWAKNLYINQIEKNLIQNIDTLSILLKNFNNIENIKSIVKDLHSELNLRITIIDEKGNVIADNTAILPASDVTIELYKDDKMILSSENVKNSENVAANEGEQTNIIFDLSRNNINISISEWGTVIQYVTVG